MYFFRILFTILYNPHIIIPKAITQTNQSIILSLSNLRLTQTPQYNVITETVLDTCAINSQLNIVFNAK